MASHAPDYGRAEALPLSALLTSLPSYPRPVIERLVARLISHLDGLDGDPDDEADPFNEGEPLFDQVWRAMVNRCPETDPNCDAEEDDPGEDENDAEPDNDGDCGEHGLDQRAVVHWGGTWRAE